MRYADISLAKDKTVVENYCKDPAYSPHCLRCPGLERMQLAEPFLWTHSCGAVHDERQVLL